MEYQQKIVILIPALNPNEKLIELVKELISNQFQNIIVVNDGSKEEYNKYFEEAKKLGAIILKHAVNLGKGRALKTGFNEYLERFHNLIGVVTADSDGQHKVEDIKKISKKLLQNPSSLVLGYRNFDEKRVPFRSKFGNKITRKVFSFFTGINIQDTQTRFKRNSY